MIGALKHSKGKIEGSYKTILEIWLGINRHE
jgi:hypothetical protein